MYLMDFSREVDKFQFFCALSIAETFCCVR